MCRREFKVPTGGFSKLNTNVFIDTLVAAQSGSSVNSDANCDVCTKVGKQGKVVASSFCMTCREKLCRECCKLHKTIKTTMDHILSPIGDGSEATEKKLGANFCKKHLTEELKFYCQVNKLPICAICSVTDHKSHETCEISEIAGEFKKNCMKYSDDVNEIMREINERSKIASELIKTFTHTVNTLRSEIRKRSEDIKRMVDEQTGVLLRELNYHEISTLKNIECDTEALRKNMMVCDNFKQFCTKVITEVDSVKVVHVADELETR